MRLTWNIVTSARRSPAHHTGGKNPACVYTFKIASASSAVFTHMQWTRRVRHNLAGAHKEAEGSKQTDVSDEGGGFEHSKGIWVTP